jgi:hypothetical protein
VLSLGAHVESRDSAGAAGRGENSRQACGSLWICRHHSDQGIRRFALRARGR